MKYKNKKYLDFIRSKPCPYCGAPAEPHHIRRHYYGAGTRLKSYDFAAVPRCRNHHDPIYEVNVNREIALLLMEYIERSIK